MKSKEEGAACSQSDGDGGGSISVYSGMEQYIAAGGCSMYPSASRPPVRMEGQLDMWK